MIITKNMLNEKVHLEMIPTRLDSATDLYTYTKNGLLLYNINPNTWNVLYPFFQKANKFTIDSYEIENKNITYKDLIEIYNNVYNTEYVAKRGFDENTRKQVLIDEFNKTYDISLKGYPSIIVFNEGKVKDIITVQVGYDLNIDDVNKFLDKNGVDLVSL